MQNKWNSFFQFSNIFVALRQHARVCAVSRQQTSNTITIFSLYFYLYTTTYITTTITRHSKEMTNECANTAHFSCRYKCKSRCPKRNVRHFKSINMNQNSYFDSRLIDNEQVPFELDDSIWIRIWFICRIWRPAEEIWGKCEHCKCQFKLTRMDRHVF